MSDRAVPTVYRNIRGFDMRIFHLVNVAGESMLVRLHW